MSCGPNPPPPDGYSVWRGYVPPELGAWAVSLLKHVSSFDYGSTWTYAYAGPPAMTVVARKDHHSWTHRNGQLVTGCFQGITLYKPRVQGVVSAGFDILDPSTAKPGSDIAIYSDTGPSWPLVVAGAVAIGVVVSAFLYVLRR